MTTKPTVAQLALVTSPANLNRFGDGPTVTDAKAAVAAVRSAEADIVSFAGKPDPFSTPLASQKRLAAFVAKRRTKALSAVDATNGRMRAAIEAGERGIDTGIAETAAHRYGPATIDRVSRMTSDQAREWVSGMIAKGNKQAAAPVIDAPHYLTSLGEAAHAMLRDQYRKTFHGDTVATLDNLRGAQEAMLRAGTYLLNSTEKLVDHDALARAEAQEAELRAAEGSAA